MSIKREQKKVMYPISLWEDIEGFAFQNFMDEPQEAQRLLIAKGLKSGKHLPYISDKNENASLRNCSLFHSQWEQINSFRFNNHINSISEAVRDLVNMGLIAEGYKSNHP